MILTKQHGFTHNSQASRCSIKGAMLAGTNLGAAVDEEREQLLGSRNGVVFAMIEVPTTRADVRNGVYHGIPK